jgi:hypothetical protein
MWKLAALLLLVAAATAPLVRAHLDAGGSHHRRGHGVGLLHAPVHAVKQVPECGMRAWWRHAACTALTHTAAAAHQSGSCVLQGNISSQLFSAQCVMHRVLLELLAATQGRSCRTGLAPVAWQQLCAYHAVQ